MKLIKYGCKSSQVLFLIVTMLFFSPIVLGFSDPIPSSPTLIIALTPTLVETNPRIAVENQSKFESNPELTHSPEPPDTLDDGLTGLLDKAGRTGSTVIKKDQAEICVTDQLRPCFDDLNSHYLHGMYSSLVFKEIGGVVAQNYKPGRSACALRLSKALNYSGHEIPFIEGKTGSGSDARWYFYRVLDMGEYLVEEFGPPDSTHYLPEGMKAIDGKKGIVYFRYCDFQYVDAYGHVDLFDGDSCTRRCPRNCYDVQFWEMP